MVYEYSGTNATGGKAYYYGLTLISQGNAAYYLYNGHGDVVQLVTSTGTLGRSYAYDAFGNEVNTVSGDTNPFRYAGQYYDTETGTYYLRARYYNPSIGRFTQQDTHWNIRNMIYGDAPKRISIFKSEFLQVNYYIPSVISIFQSQNRYIYCVGNPIRYIDYTGKSVEEVKAFFHAVMAGFVLATEALSPVYSTCGVATVVDGPLPVADTVAAIVAGITTIGAVGYGVYHAMTNPVTAKAEVKVKSEEKDERRSSSSEVIYFGADMYGGTWKLVTPPMGFSAASEWAYFMAESNTYGKKASWGLYTFNQNDAFFMAQILGGGLTPVHDDAKMGEYPHYHVYDRIFNNMYKHFHVWYGTIG